MALAPLVEPSGPLSAHEIERYSRQVLLPHVGMQGQRRLKNARVLVVGAGGLGSPVLIYLAAALGGDPVQIARARAPGGGGHHWRA